MVLTGETEVLGEKHYTAWVVDGWMSMEHLREALTMATEVLGEKLFTAWVVDEGMGMEQ